MVELLRQNCNTTIECESNRGNHQAKSVAYFKSAQFNLPKWYCVEARIETPLEALFPFPVTIFSVTASRCSVIKYKHISQ